MTGARPNLGEGRLNSIVVIGGGPGGYPAAIRAAQLGADVVLVEKGQIGGTCLHRGCIPTKFLLKAAREYQDHLRLHEEAGERIPGPDRIRIATRMGQVVEHLAKGTSSLLGKNGVRVVAGTASFVEPGVVRIAESGEILRASSFIVATGAGPSRPPLDGAELPGVVDSDGILALDTIPQTLAIIGGGVVGIEFAQIFRCLGTRVTVLEKLPSILATEDVDVSAVVLRTLTASGVDIHLSTSVTGISRKAGLLRVSFAQGEKSSHVDAEKVLLAVGRRPVLDDLGGDRIKLKLQDGFVDVNDKLETNVRGVYAVGDVTGGLLLAHKAAMEGERAAENAAGVVRKLSYKAVPRVVYTSPEIASIGLTETEARCRFERLLVGRFPFSMNGRAVLEGLHLGFVKIIAEAETEAIVGVSIVGAHAADLIGEATLAVQLEATLEDLAETMHAHPTFSEALREAALDARSVAIHLPPRAKQVVGYRAS